MEQKRTVVINLNLDWRVLAALGIIAGILILAYSAVSAQLGDPPNINSVEAEPAASPPEEAPAMPVDSAETQKGDLRLTTNGEWVPVDEIGVTSSSAAGAGAITAAGGGKPHFYLTDATYETNQVKTACATGYHMASLWEILDVSNLIYDYDHPAAHVKDDSGQGPPSYWYGWIRTGQDSSGSGTTGSGNCLNWTTTGSSEYGVAVRLSRTWETAPGDIFTWDATSFSCGFLGEVWCVKD
jgi:hypothetical protein